MADLTTSTVRQVGIAGAAPVYTAISASDTFKPQPNARYILHYKNGATPTGAGVFSVTDPTTPVPAGSAATPGFADAVIKANGVFAATTELIAQIPNSNRFMDANGNITLVHGGGTLTTVSVAILGPFPV